MYIPSSNTTLVLPSSNSLVSEISPSCKERYSNVLDSAFTGSVVGFFLCIPGYLSSIQQATVVRTTPRSFTRGAIKASVVGALAGFTWGSVKLISHKVWESFSPKQDV